MSEKELTDNRDNIILAPDQDNDLDFEGRDLYQLVEDKKLLDSEDDESWSEDYDVSQSIEDNELLDSEDDDLYDF